MIRINLIGQARKGKRRAGISLPQIPNVGILLFVLLLVAMGAVFYSWHSNAAEVADGLSQKLAMRKLELEQLQQAQTEITAAREETRKLQAQVDLFDELFADKTGPVNALTYLAFILQPRDQAVAPSDELKAMEAAGWRVAWDARKAWFTSLRETQGEVTLTGEALDHEDVAEVTRRLESSPYFRQTKLVFQERKKDEKVGVPYIEFTVRGSLVYLIVPMQPAKPAEAPAEAATAPAEAAPPAEAATPSAPAEAPKLVPIVPAPVRPDAAATPPAADAGATEEPDTAAEPEVTAPAPPPPARAEPPAAAPAPEAPAARAPLPTAPPSDRPPPAEAAESPGKLAAEPAPTPED